MGAGLLITALLHLAIIYCYLLQRHAPAGAAAGPRAAIQWLLPLASPTPPLPRTAPTPPPKRLPPPETRLPVRDVPPPPAPAQPQAVTPTPSPEDIFAQPVPAPARAPSAADIMQQAKLDIGKIDKDLRKAFPEREWLPPPDSMRAKLERGINAAHDAVPPKWYQGARIVELSTPDGENKSRLYKIITALGAYCIHIAPDGRRGYTLCPT